MWECREEVYLKVNKLDSVFNENCSLLVSVMLTMQTKYIDTRILIQMVPMIHDKKLHMH